MKQALRAVPYMAISSESLLSAVMDMEGTQKWNTEVPKAQMFHIKDFRVFCVFCGSKKLVYHSCIFVDRKFSSFVFIDL